jgi:hypothetical protein
MNLQLGIIFQSSQLKWANELSERKWKAKFKEWKFDKNISATDMNMVLAKAEKRTREEGKDTGFFPCRNSNLSRNN